MIATAWMLAVLIAAAFGYVIWRAYGQWTERQRASQARIEGFVAQAKNASAPVALSPAPALPPAAAMSTPPVTSTPAVQEQLLFDAATKAALAGEPVLAIQLFARLLARYPQSGLGERARMAVAEQKKKLPRI